MDYTQSQCEFSDSYGYRSGQNNELRSFVTRSYHKRLCQFKAYFDESEIHINDLSSVGCELWYLRRKKKTPKREQMIPQHEEGERWKILDSIHLWNVIILHYVGSFLKAAHRKISVNAGE